MGSNCKYFSINHHLLVLIVAYIIGTIITMIRFYGFSVMLENEQLKIEYGLFNKKKVTVPTKRLQAVVERQSYIRRLLATQQYILSSQVILKIKNRR